MRSNFRLFPLLAFGIAAAAAALVSCAEGEGPGWRSFTNEQGGAGGSGKGGSGTGGSAKGGSPGNGGTGTGGTSTGGSGTGGSGTGGSGTGGSGKGGSGTGGTSKGGSGTGGSGTGGSGVGGSGGGCTGACSECVEIQNWYGFSDPYGYTCSDCIDQYCATEMSTTTSSCPSNFKDPCVSSCSSDMTCFCSCMTTLSGGCGPAVAQVFACIYANCNSACQ